MTYYSKRYQITNSDVLKKTILITALLGILKRFFTKARWKRLSIMPTQLLQKRKKKGAKEKEYDISPLLEKNYNNSNWMVFWCDTIDNVDSYVWKKLYNCQRI